MELVALARVLWRRRLLLVLGAFVALAVGLVLMRGPSTRSGVASLRIALDTRTSQLVDASGAGADSLTWRAELLADLAGSRTVVDQISRQTGVPADQLVVSAPYLSIPIIPTPLPTRALDAAAASPAPYRLSVGTDEGVPIISIEARGPDPILAARLATATADALETTVLTPGAVPKVHDVVVDRVSKPHVRELTDRPARKIAAGAAVVVFGLWCAAVGLLSRLPRRLQNARPPRMAQVAGR
jgi:hypothetical protein